MSKGTRAQQLDLTELAARAAALAGEPVLLYSTHPGDVSRWVF